MTPRSSSIDVEALAQEIAGFRAEACEHLACPDDPPDPLGIRRRAHRTLGDLLDPTSLEALAHNIKHHLIGAEKEADQ